eukprot:9486038-Pyramimonas_sp.AAC.1
MQYAIRSSIRNMQYNIRALNNSIRYAICDTTCGDQAHLVHVHQSHLAPPRGWYLAPPQLESDVDLRVHHRRAGGALARQKRKVGLLVAPPQVLELRLVTRGRS